MPIHVIFIVLRKENRMNFVSTFHSISLVLKGAFCRKSSISVVRNDRLKPDKLLNLAEYIGCE